MTTNQTNKIANLIIQLSKTSKSKKENKERIAFLGKQLRFEKLHNENRQNKANNKPDEKMQFLFETFYGKLNGEIDTLTRIEIAEKLQKM